MSASKNARQGRKEIRSDIAWSTPDQIAVMGYDLVNDLIGKINLGDMSFLEITGRLPNERESVMFNAMLVTSVEHGIVPSTLATRLTFAGAPESLQSAVAAGLLGLGTVFNGSTEGAASMLMKALPDPKADVPLPALAEQVVEEHRAARRQLSGIGHPIHKPVDPRAIRLFALAEENGFSGRYVALMKLIQTQAEKVSGKVLPINSTGAKGAICCEMGLSPTITRGLGVISRAVGLVGHILEESRNPIALEIWHRMEDEATGHIRGKFTKGSAEKPGSESGSD